MIDAIIKNGSSKQFRETQGPARYLISAENISLDFKTKEGVHPVLKDVTLRIKKGEFVSIIGHSGCGKSTLLNIFAGLLKPTLGGVILEDKEVDSPGPERAVVFQNHSLLPWLTVYENVRLAIDKVFGQQKSKAERDDWTCYNLKRVQMDQASGKYPMELSGGMKQRVGIARALAMEPKALLMDEPFGALDALTRAQLQDVLLEIHAELGNTVIMITHDVDEAVLLSDRIIMMTHGPGATIGEALSIDLPRPRNRIDLLDDPDYQRYRSKGLRFLHQLQRRNGPE